MDRRRAWRCWHRRSHPARALCDSGHGIRNSRDVWHEHMVTIYDLGLHKFEELTGSLLTDSTPDERFERPARVRSHHGLLPSRCRVLEGLLTLTDHASTQQGSLAKPGLRWNFRLHRNRSRRDLGAAASGRLVHISAYLGSGHRGTWRHRHCHPRSLLPLQRPLALLRGPPPDRTRYNRCVKWRPPRALTARCPARYNGGQKEVDPAVR